MVSVREIEKKDIELITDYWLNSSGTFLEAMGVDLKKIPLREQWTQMLSEQINQSYHEKKSYCLIWMADGKATGHSNVNKIIFGDEAYMHLHLWNAGERRKGMGTLFVKMTLPYFFKNLQLKDLYCEPFALNPAPNKTLEKTGFEFIKEYITIPGHLNFEQPVKRWHLSLQRFNEMKMDTGT